MLGASPGFRETSSVVYTLSHFLNTLIPLLNTLTLLLNILMLFTKINILMPLLKYPHAFTKSLSHLLNTVCPIKGRSLKNSALRAGCNY